MIEYKNIKNLAHSNVLRARNIEHLVCSDVFKELYKKYYKYLMQCVIREDLAGLKEFIKKTKEKDLPIKYWSSRRLRKRASELKIKNYGKLPSVVLIEKIEEKENEKRERESN